MSGVLDPKRGQDGSAHERQLKEASDDVEGQELGSIDEAPADGEDEGGRDPTPNRPEGHNSRKCRYDHGD